MPRVFRDYNVNQPMLFGPDVREWLSDAHPSHFISDVMEKLDLTEDTRSSRKLEKATYEDVAFRLPGVGFG